MARVKTWKDVGSWNGKNASSPAEKISKPATSPASPVRVGHPIPEPQH